VTQTRRKIRLHRPEIPPFIAARCPGMTVNQDRSREVISAGSLAPSFRPARPEGRLWRPLSARRLSALQALAPAWWGAFRPVSIPRARFPSWRAVKAARAGSPARGDYRPSRSPPGEARRAPARMRPITRRAGGRFFRSLATSLNTPRMIHLRDQRRLKRIVPGNSGRPIQSASRPASPSSAAKARSVPLAFQASAATAGPPFRRTRISAPSAIRTISTVPSS